MSLRHIYVTSRESLSLPRPASVRSRSSIRIAIQVSANEGGGEGRGGEEGLLSAVKGRRCGGLLLHDPGRLG